MARRISRWFVEVTGEIKVQPPAHMAVSEVQMPLLPGPVLVGQDQSAPGGVDAVLVMGTPGCSWAVLPAWTKAEQHQEGSVCFPLCAML